jgi:hypothetical protein
MATNRTRQVIHGSTLNINGVSAGGLMSANIDAGFDSIIRASHDGLSFPVNERLIPYVRGSITCQDWEKVISVFNGTLGTYTFYEALSGAATYYPHTITNPVIHSFSLNLLNGGYSSVTWNFECKPADGTKTITDMFASGAAAAKPAYLASQRAVKIVSATHVSAIGYVTGATVNFTSNLLREMSDGGLGYTTVEAAEPYNITGSVTFQNNDVASSKQYLTLLLTGAASDLVIVMKDSGLGGTATLTIKNVFFTTGNANKTSDGGYNSCTANFIMSDSSGVGYTPATAITFT